MKEHLKYICDNNNVINFLEQLYSNANNRTEYSGFTESRSFMSKGIRQYYTTITKIEYNRMTRSDSMVITEGMVINLIKQT